LEPTAGGRLFGVVRTDMSKLMVTSVVHDPQQAFVDVVDTASHDATLQTVLPCREYRCYGLGYAPAGLRALAERRERGSSDFFEEVT
jgi:hypothetical protein